MDIVLSVISNDRREITKTPSNELTLSGTLRNETNLIDVDILIEIENPSSYNYMFISDFGRYYFITDFQHVRKDLWRIRGHVDVLFSFKDQILASPSIIDRSSNEYSDNYMLDDMWKSKVKCSTDIMSFPNGLNTSGEYILITAGG